MIKKFLFILVVFILGLSIIYFDDIKNSILKNKIYVVFRMGENDNTEEGLPKKYVTRSPDGLKFGIRISKYQEYLFQHNKFETIDIKTIESFDLVSCDSISKLLLKSPFDPSIAWYVIKINDVNNDAWIADAKPVIIDY